jgi:hypothetical protein
VQQPEESLLRPIRAVGVQPELFASVALQELASAFEPVGTHHAFQNHVTNFTQGIKDNRRAPVVFEALGASRNRAQLSHFCDQVEHYLTVRPDAARATDRPNRWKCNGVTFEPRIAVGYQPKLFEMLRLGDKIAQDASLPSQP